MEYNAISGSKNSIKMENKTSVSRCFGVLADVDISSCLELADLLGVMILGTQRLCHARAPSPPPMEHVIKPLNGYPREMWIYQKGIVVANSGGRANHITLLES
jgi:hypothetical protein